MQIMYVSNRYEIRFETTWPAWIYGYDIHSDVHIFLISSKTVSENMHQLYSIVRFLSERKYTKDHEWISMSDDVGTVGITNYAQVKLLVECLKCILRKSVLFKNLLTFFWPLQFQNLLGDVVYIDLPDIGTKFDQNGWFLHHHTTSTCRLEPFIGNMTNILFHV